MKKLLSVIIILLLSVIIAVGLASCKSDPSDIKIVVPDGAPALAIAKLIKDNAQFDGYNITYEIVAGATEIQSKFANGEAAIAVMPTNMASIFNANNDAKILSVLTHGVLYLVGKENVESLSNLKGEVVYNIGRGSVPDITFKYILEQNNIPYVEGDTATQNKVTLSYATNGAEIIGLLKQGGVKFGILGEPAVSKAVIAAGVSVQFSITELWEAATEGKEYPQAVLTVQNSFFTDKNKAFLSWILDKIEENMQWIKENPNDAVASLNAVGSTIDQTLSKGIIDNCNLWVSDFEETKSAVSSFLNIIFEFNKTAIGGKLPPDSFYASI